MCGTPVSRTLLVSLEAKRVHDKTVIMTYLNEHTHTHRFGVLENLKDVSERPLGLPRSAIKWTPPAAIKAGPAFISRGGALRRSI